MAVSRGRALSVPEVGSRLEPRLRIISPEGAAGWRELRESRDLLFFLAWRDVKVRYAQSILGVGWAVGQPLLMMGVFAVFLGVLAKVPSPQGVPYAVFALCGLVPWTFFANAVTSAGQSIVNSAGLVEKVYFPRLLVPVAAMAAWLPDLAVALVILGGALAVAGVTPAWPAVLLLPACVGLAVAAAASVGVWVSALNVAYRDVKYAVPFLLQLGLFATPIAYSSELVPEGARTFYGLNPMVGVVEGFRYALLGSAPPSWPMMGASALVVAVVMFTGLRYFRRVERYFADVI